MQVHNMKEWREGCRKNRIVDGAVIHDDKGGQFVKLNSDSPSVPMKVSEFGVIRTMDGMILGAEVMIFPVGVSDPDEYA